MLVNMIQMYLSFKQYRRNLAELTKLSDRDLEDVGLRRNELGWVAAGVVTR